MGSYGTLWVLKNFYVLLCVFWVPISFHVFYGCLIGSYGLL